MEDLLRELALYGRLAREEGQEEKRIVDTVYLGGGTPSLLSPSQMERLLLGVREHFALSQGAEISMEANPESLNRELIRSFRDLGGHRLSLGVQSLNDEMLRRMGRIHDGAAARRAYELAREELENVSLDLILALSGQSMEMWEKDLMEVLDLEGGSSGKAGPAHLSLYGLQLEEGTPFYEGYKAGRFPLPGNEEERAMYRLATEMLEEAGYEHYEISNWAREGRRCRHNEKYWRMEDFLGLGPGASSYFGGRRFADPAEPEAYHLLIEGGKTAYEEAAPESQEDAMGIFCFTALRTREGLDKERFRERFGRSFEEVFSELLPRLKELEEEGSLRVEGERIALTASGIDKSNDIMSDFV